MAVRLLGRTKYLYLGRGGGYEGVWISDEKPKSYLRKKNRFLEYLRKHLSSCRLVRLDIPFSDRLVVLEYYKWGKLNKLILFYKGRDLDIIHHYYDEDKIKFFTNTNIIFSGTELVEKNELQQFFQGDLKNFEEQKENHIKIEDLLIQEETKARNKSSGKKEKFLKRKIKNIESDFNKVKVWPKLQEMANNYYIKPFPLDKKVMGIKFSFNDSASEGQKLNIIYNKIKNLQKAEKLLEQRLNDSKEKLAKMNLDENNLKSIIVLPSIQSKTNNIETKKMYITTMINELKIGYGQSAQGNDQLRKEWAYKEDIWFHLENESSPHIIIKDLKISNLREDHFHLVAELMNKIMSDSRTELDLIFTEVKNLKGVKGQPGSVTVKKQRHRRIKLS